MKIGRGQAQVGHGAKARHTTYVDEVMRLVLAGDIRQLRHFAKIVVAVVDDDVADGLAGDLTRCVGGSLKRIVSDHHHMLALRTRRRTAVEAAHRAARLCGGVVDEVRAKTVVAEAHRIEGESVLLRVEIADSGNVRRPLDYSVDRIVELEQKRVIAAPRQIVFAITT